jgi:hypothetical protein
VYIEVFGSPIIVLNTIGCANALLDGTNYSHRPVFTYAGELMGTNRVRLSCPLSQNYLTYGNIRA